MKVPMQWLKQYADVPVSAKEYEEQMIMHGTGVEGIEDVAQQVQNVVVGRVLSVVKHENSDHMVICQVDVGDEVLQIVTARRTYLRARWCLWPSVARCCGRQAHPEG